MSEQAKALDALFSAMAKKHGKVIKKMSSDSVGTLLGACATPLEALDRYILGCGGFAFERISEVYGPEASGKSSLVMGCLAKVQAAGGIGIYVDAENACTQERAGALGVNRDELIMADDLDNAEHAGQIVLDAVRAHTAKVPLLCAFDSVAAMQTKREADADVGDNLMAEKARFMSQYLPALVKALRGKHAHVIFVNQVRSKVGLVFGNPEVTPGGNALKFYASHRFRTSAVKKRDGGLEGKIKSTKSRYVEPGRELATFLHFKDGWDNEWTTLNLAKDLKLIEPRDRDVSAARAALEWPVDEAIERLGGIAKSRGKKKAKESDE
jgi:recombination protein RecA